MVAAVRVWSYDASASGGAPYLTLCSRAKEGGVSSFEQSVILLLMTAGLTGIGAPFILRKVDERRAQRQGELDAQRLRAQKVFEADLARQSKTIDAQVAMLEAFSKMVWDFQML